jgi:hypothetical protein
MTKTNPHPTLHVKPDDIVVPIREKRTEDGSRVAEIGEPIAAKDLWRENDGR